MPIHPANPSRAQLWFGFLVVLTASLGVNFIGIGQWPWDHDEVASLVELGIYETPHDKGRFATQVERLPKLVPVWYSLQGLFLRVLPADEFGSRVLSALCGSLTVALAFLFAWKRKTIWFAVALALLVGLNQTYVWLVQQNRFYSMGMLFLVITMAAIWSPSEKTRQWPSFVVCGFAALLAVLSHNLVAVVLWIGGLAAIMCLPLRLMPKTVGLKAILAAGVAALTYVFYLRPLMGDWISGGTGGTNEVVSFVAQLGMPTFAFAAMGIGWSLKETTESQRVAWWTLLLIGGLMFIALSPILLGNWNPRYAFFLMPAFWVFAAVAVEKIALRTPGSWQRFVLYCFVVALLSPKLMSHWRDGSRHDFRAAAQYLQAHSQKGEFIYCDWPLTLEYYTKGYDLGPVRVGRSTE